MGPAPAVPGKHSGAGGCGARYAGRRGTTDAPCLEPLTMSSTADLGGDRPWMTDELQILRSAVRELIMGEFAPQFARWRSQGFVDRAAWSAAGAAGLLCPAVAEIYGGSAGSFAHDCVIVEELEYAGIGLGFSLALHNSIVVPYIERYGTDAQRQQWLPKCVSGELVTAIAMTEPGTGSDLQAIRTRARRVGDEYRIDGQKTFISNGQLADLVITVCRTGEEPGARGLSLIVVPATAAGFRRGRNLEKIGLKASDTSELFYEDARVPAENVLGGIEGQGFRMLMEQLPQERLIIAVGAVAAMERAVALTTDYARERKAFGQPILSFQHTQFTLAECHTEAEVTRAFLDRCIGRHLAGKLDARTASMAKYWCTERQNQVIDRCLQVFGGNGYMAEYPIGQMFVDARVQKIYGGTNEIMKMLIARSL
jgi:acyl-CoA dehydrogenase